MLLAGSCELASLLVHRFQPAYSLGGLQFELPADQALIDAGLSWARRDDQLEPRCSQRAIQRGQTWVRVGPLELSDCCLADCESLCEIGLRKPCSPSSVCKQLAGERRRTSG
jgi:hypothetical protein